MKTILVFLSLLAIADLSRGSCPTNAVFLTLGDQVRGYPLRANGPTAPCQVISGSNTTLGTARALAFSKNNYFHIAQFLTNGMVSIFPPGSDGNAAPSRSVNLPENDLTSIAVDSRINDFVLSIRQPTAPIFVAPSTSSGFLANPLILSDTFAQYASLAIDGDDNLLIAGYDSHGVPRIDTLGTGQNLSSPPLVRSLGGSATGLLSGASFFGTNNITIALDPEANELYVYNVSTDQSKIQVSIFAARANGNVAPQRVISGSLTQITGPGFAGAGKISVSSDGRLFVSEPNERILVFAPGANGNIAPSQIIRDSTIGSSSVDQGGIGVRSCRCQ